MAGGRKDREYSGRHRKGGENGAREAQETIEAETESEAITREKIARKWVAVSRKIVATLERVFLRRHGGGIATRTGKVARARNIGTVKTEMRLARGKVPTEQLGKRDEL